MTKFRFAAFIMTFERPGILRQTVDILQKQSYPPELILIVDNSESLDTQRMVKDILSPELAYHRMGYNSGPAGAAKVGLEKLTALGYHWIYWGDDDNPPPVLTEFENHFKNLEGLLSYNFNVGIFSGKGGMLNKYTGRIRSLSNAQLEKSAFLEVDTVPGGHTLLVNADVVKQGILPDESLFFGFEELDFTLRVKKEGFRVFIDADTWLRARKKAKNQGADFRPKASGFGKIGNLQREYYSTRNLLLIFFQNKYYFAFLFYFLKTIIKSFLGFKFGYLYGVRNFKIQWKAIIDFLSGKGGQL